MRVLELRTVTPVRVFDVVDRFAEFLGTRGRHPRPLDPVRFLVLARAVPDGRVELDPPVELETRRNDDGYHVFFGRLVTSRRETAGVPLAAGTYAVRVESRSYQPWERNVDLVQPRPPLRINLDPGYDYPFPVVSRPPPPGQMPPNGAPLRLRGPTLLRGSVLAADGAGVAAATVRATGSGCRYATDDSGRWVLAFPDDLATGTRQVTVAVPGQPAVTVPVTVEQGGETVLRQTALEGRVRISGGPGIEGATVEVTGRPGTTRSRPDGTWSYHFPPDQQDETVQVTAVLPDGRRQTRDDVAVTSRSTASVAEFEFPRP
jgi:hypothetical protein